jgi:hypothetical protein
MATKVYQVAKTGGDINSLRTELNDKLRQMSYDLANLRGEGGALVKFNGDIDMQGNRVKNLGETRDPGDAPSKAEIQKNGLYATGKGHVASAPIISKKGISIETDASGRNNFGDSTVVTRGDVRIILRTFGLI